MSVLDYIEERVFTRVKKRGDVIDRGIRLYVEPRVYERTWARIEIRVIEPVWSRVKEEIRR